MAKKNPHGHYCKVCGSYKPNEQFSGKGHKQHICKKCMQLPVKERERRMNPFPDDDHRPTVKGGWADEQEYKEMMESLFGDYTDADVDMMGTVMDAVNERGFDKVINDWFYHYEQPDYAGMCTPMEEHLHKLYHTDGLERMLERAEMAAEVMERQKPGVREKSVSNMLLNVMADYQRNKTAHEMAMLGALWLAERFDLVGIADTVLELLRQDATFFTRLINNNEPLLILAISRLCRNQLPMLTVFTEEDGLIPDGLSIVADSVIQMAINQPEHRHQVIEWICELLERMEEPDADPDPAILGHIAYSLLQIKAVEAIPHLKECFEMYCVPRIECRGGYRWLKKQMTKGIGDRRVPFDTIDVLLKMYLIMEDEEDEDDEDWDDEEIDDGKPWESPIPYPCLNSDSIKDNELPF